MAGAPPPVPASDALARLVRAREVPAVVVFSGEESFLAEEGVAAVARALFPDGDPGGAVVTLDGGLPADQERVASVLEELATPSLFGEGKLVVIRRAEAVGGAAADADDDEGDGEDGAGEADEAPAPSARPARAGDAPAKPGRRASPITTLVKQATAAAQPGAVLVLVTKKPVRGKGSVSAEAITKTGAMLVDCRRLYDAPPPWARGGSAFDTEVSQWVVRRAKSLHGKTMDLRTAHALVLRRGSGLAGLAQAVATLSAYVGARPAVTEADVAATIGETREDPAWVLADAVLDRDVVKALDHVAAAFDRGLSDGRGRVAVRPEAIFPMLVSALLTAWRRAMLVAEAAARGEDPASVPSLLGLPSFVVERAVRQAARRDPEDLLRRHRAFVEAEAGVRGGGLPPRLAAERLVAILAA
ncbi:MAG: hypothetical protein IT460_02450 [Planctomycetes bacterium]|nr:hypothetical protein [Planctomycetota bacterium]